MNMKLLFAACAIGGVAITLPFYDTYGYPALLMGGAIGVIFFMQLRNYLL
jgi:hypothetical protein